MHTNLRGLVCTTEVSARVIGQSKKTSTTKDRNCRLPTQKKWGFLNHWHFFLLLPHSRSFPARKLISFLSWSDFVKTVRTKISAVIARARKTYPQLEHGVMMRPHLLRSFGPILRKNQSSWNHVLTRGNIACLYCKVISVENILESAWRATLLGVYNNYDSPLHQPLLCPDRCLCPNIAHRLNQKEEQWRVV